MTNPLLKSLVYQTEPLSDVQAELLALLLVCVWPKEKVTAFVLEDKRLATLYGRQLSQAKCDQVRKFLSAGAVLLTDDAIRRRMRTLMFGALEEMERRFETDEHWKYETVNCETAIPEEENNMTALITPIGSLSYPALFEARAPMPNAKPRFSAVLVLDAKAAASAELKAIKRACIDAARAKFGNDVDIKSLRSPFRDCSERAGKAGFDVEGGIFFNAWTYNKPGIIGPDKAEIMIPSDVWAGQLARFSVNPFAYDQSGNKGMAIGLNNVQIAKFNMPRVDGRVAPDKEFGSIGTGEDDMAAGGGVDDLI